MAKIFTAEDAENAEGRCFFSVSHLFLVVFRTIPEDNKKSHTETGEVFISYTHYGKGGSKCSELDFTAGVARE